MSLKKELAEGQLYQMQELTIRQQEKARPQENAQTSAQTPNQVLSKKELAEGQLYQMQELTIRQQENARPQEKGEGGGERITLWERPA